MARVAPLVAVALAVAGLGGLAWAQWGSNPEPGEVDLVVEGTLVSLGSGMAWAHGQTYDLKRGTIVVHRVVYAEEGAQVGTTVELFSAQRSDVICPRVYHEHDLLQRGLWLLQRTSSPGVYTSYMAQSVLGPDGIAPVAPRVRVDGGVFDPLTGRVALQLRYENFSPDTAVFDEVSLDERGHVRGLGAVNFVDWRGSMDPARTPASLEPAVRSLHVAPWSFTRSTLDLTGLSSLAGAGDVSLWIDEGGERPAPGGWIWCGPEETPADDPPLFLQPDDAIVVVMPALSPDWLLLVAAVAAAPLVTRGRTWRWTPLARTLGCFVAVTALALVPWAIVGVGPTAPVALAADVLLLMGLGVTLRRLGHGRVVPAAALATVLIVVAPRALALAM